MHIYIYNIHRDMAIDKQSCMYIYIYIYTHVCVCSFNAASGSSTIPRTMTDQSLPSLSSLAQGFSAR